ncbi:zinc-dependent metalloprotease [Blastococcus brunescens]|uniref:Zinc-dependent metalloprotease n=1 Tax=Blastococcus brunescens TaxID=1564165 RepID=A0ABZ1B470_9ACTN|nr:zinc-dependent metalloprotease [Blastococcus sp. BMG 8361]WRL64531.1 zinc-dependent metalloprotease [Blastococcus sp. BMG 8361]
MSSASSLVDWNLAGRTARRLMSAGPATTRDEAAGVVRDLHEAAAVAVSHVEQLTGLRAVDGGPAPEVVVVDRPGWVDANTHGMAALLDPLVEALTARQDSRPGPIATAIGSRATGIQAGGLLAFLSSRVLGQYEVFGTGAGSCSSPPTSSPPSGSSASTPPTSGCGSASTRSPTSCSSRPCRGSRNTWRRRSPGSSRPPTSAPTSCASASRTCCAASPTPSAARTASPRG